MLTVVLVVLVLYLARALLIPIALAIVLAFVLTPVVTRLERLGIGRIASVILTVATTLALVAALMWAVAAQTLSLAEDLPQYRAKIRARIDTFKSEAEGWTSRARRAIDVVREEISGATAPPAMIPPGAERFAEEVDEEPTEVELASSPVPETIVGAGQLAVGSVIVVVFMTLILLKREDLRDRAIALAGADQLNVTTELVDDAAGRVSRYLSTLLAVNIGFGAAIAIGLFLIGVPNALLFGALVIPLRFVPVLGLWIATGLPTLVAMIVLDGWWPPLLTLGLFAAVEFIAAYLVEPWAFGSRTGVSIAAVMLALVFWTWLWGAAGLVLAMPITVCLAVIGRHLPHHRWLGVLLDERPALPPPARVYQRLLAGRADDALAVARAVRETHGLERTYDEVILPAIVLLEHDRHAGSIAEERERFALLELGDIIDDLAEDEQSARFEADPTAALPQRFASPVLCVPARSRADELAIAMLAHLLRRRGREVESLSADSLFSERVTAVRESDASTVCLSAMTPSSEAHVRLTCRRLGLDRLERVERPGSGTRRVIVGLWGADLAGDRAPAMRDRLRDVGANVIVTRLAEAVRALAGEAGESAAASKRPKAD